MSAVRGGQSAFSMRRGPTPVLDALEAAVATPVDEFWGGAISSLVKRIAKVGIVSMTERYSAFCNVFEEVYPDPGTLLFAGSTWIETTLPMTCGGDDHYPAGVLVEVFGPNMQNEGDTWFFDRQKLTFVIYRDDYLILVPGRVCFAPNLAALASGNIPLTANPSLAHFSDFERIRHNLQPASTATAAELHRMHSSAVELGGHLIRSTGAIDVPPVHKDLPRYSMAVEVGNEGLRHALMTTYIERGSLEPGSEAAEIHAGLAVNLLYRGPIIALNLLRLLVAPRYGVRFETAMPEPFARGRKAIVLDREPRGNVVPLR